MLQLLYTSNKIGVFSYKCVYVYVDAALVTVIATVVHVHADHFNYNVGVAYCACIH